MEKFKMIGVTKKFGSHSLFPHPLNLSFNAGDIVALIGDNGVGKTTLVKLICGLICPDTGQIMVNGVDGSLNRRQWMRDVGALLEGTRSVYWRLSAYQNFIYFAGLKEIFGRKAAEQAERKLKLFGLWDDRDKKVELFSLGMKQRLALACSTIHDPTIVLLDEPTTGLDAKSSEVLENYISDLSRNGATVIFTSHDKEMVHRVSNRILMIKDGAVHDIPKNYN